jgi:hypothetical protein
VSHGREAVLRHIEGAGNGIGVGERVLGDPGVEGRLEGGPEAVSVDLRQTLVAGLVGVEPAVEVEKVVDPALAGVAGGLLGFDPHG